MTLCEKCIHEEVCDQSSRQMWSAMASETECTDFKNKADFVKVVRCKDCRRSNSMIFKGFYRCGRWRRTKRENDFCSCGERRTV